MMRALYSNRAVRFLSAISLNFYIWHQVLALKLKEWHIPTYSVDLPQQNAGEPWRIRYTAICWLAAFLARLSPLQESSSVRKTKETFSRRPFGLSKKFSRVLSCLKMSVAFLIRVLMNTATTFSRRFKSSAM